jgi:DNA (cytosine-5)-methyltransferase 1
VKLADRRAAGVNPVHAGEGKPVTAIDLFAGAGGLSLGLTSAGFEVVGAVDNWRPAAESYTTNFSHPFLEIDLGTTSGPKLCSLLGIAPGEVDLVAGGPPCQGFSIQRIGRDLDARNHLIITFAEQVVALQPRMFVMENVPGLLGKRGAALAEQFSAQLEEAGYGVRSERVNTAAFGVPQLRRRVLIYGWRRDSVAPFQPPEGSVREDEFHTVWSAIGNLHSPPADFTPQASDPLHRRMRMSELNLRRISMVPPGGGFEHLPRALRVACHRDGPERIGHRNVYGRLHPDQPAGTLTARFDSFTRGKFAHPFEDRNITLREGARLQTFPDDHVFVGTQEEIAALIGNSVPPLFASHIATAALSHLKVGIGDRDSASTPIDVAGDWAA